MKKAWDLFGISLFALTVVISGGKTLLPTAAYAASMTGPNVVNVVAKEYEFEMPDSLPAGPTLFHFTDEGNQAVGLHVRRGIAGGGSKRLDR